MFRDVTLHDPWPEILHRAQQIAGAPRHLSVHCGGVVITPGRLDRCVPLQFAPKGVPIIQWEKDQAEMAGLVKIDLLGNRSLAVIRDALAAVRDGHLYEVKSPLILQPGPAALTDGLAALQRIVRGWVEGRGTA